MKVVKGIHDLNCTQGCVLSIGNFDGVHLGHRQILSAVVEHAQRLNVPAVVMTFEPHPAALLAPQKRPPRLTTAEEKAQLIAQQGIDFVLEYPTDQKLLNLSPRDFFDQIVVAQLNAVGLVEGPNFYFGKGRSGSGQTLQEFCQESGRFLEIISPALLNGEIVSSSAIRDALRAGNVKSAAEMLKRNYSIRGVVSVGAKRGRTIGFPTANLEQIPTMLPGEGVYAVWAEVGGQVHPAALNIGPNPTFEESQQKVEAHLLDVSVDLYGHELCLKFVDRIRGLHKFNSVEELQVQIASDIKRIRQVLADDPGEPVS